MRTCTFQIYVDGTEPRYEGSKYFKQVLCEPRRGVFLQWGHDSGDEGAVWSVALVEDEQGRVHTVMPDQIKFTDKNFSKVWKE